MLHFQNSLTRKAEPFVPLDPEEVGLYTCGPTVYDFAHIGNLRTYTFEDLLRRYLNYRGFRVKQVMNLTDIDDKTIRGSRQKKISLEAYTRPFIEAFHRDIALLNIEPAEVYPKATEHIPEMVKLIETLLEKGVAYRGEDGSVYFSIHKFPAYGKLAHLDMDGLKAGARVKQDEYSKESFSDFALWKAWDEEDGEVFWETSLGKGRPGWHIECSAMSMKYLGETFELHTGGVDNLFPHHENEIAQSEAATGKPFVRCWLHSEHLLVDNQKMSKSLGNFYTLGDLKKQGFSPLSLRWLYISSHYRAKLNFTLEGLKAAEKTLKGIYDFVQRLQEAGEGDTIRPQLSALVEDCHKGFLAGMDDDLNASLAVSWIFKLMNQANQWMNEGGINRAEAAVVKEWLFDIDAVLGLKLESAQNPPELTPEDKNLLAQRLECRKNKDFARSDEIRKQFTEKGYLLEDTPFGTRVKKI